MTYTPEQIEAALCVMAHIVSVDPRGAPLFDRLEQELDALKRRDDSVIRAKRFLSTYKSTGGSNAILSSASRLTVSDGPRP